VVHAAAGRAARECVVCDPDDVWLTAVSSQLSGRRFWLKADS
jgi:regulator of extracellular matrix RemA (YlzA/DUF370 family)